MENNLQNKSLQELVTLAKSYISKAPNTQIKADEIGSTTPFKVPKYQATSDAPALGGIVESGATAYVSQQAEAAKMTEVQEKETKTARSFADYVSGLFGTKGETALKDEVYRATKVDNSKQELDDINNKIIAEQRALKKSIEATRARPGGSLAGEQDEIRRLERDSTSKQADLAVIQMAKQNKYANAKEIADRAVALRMEETKERNAILKLIYDENKEQFTRAEQREYDEKLKTRDQNEKKKEAELKAISDLSLEALQKGAPVSTVMAMRAADSMDGALKIGGSYFLPKPTTSYDPNKLLTVSEAKELNLPFGTTVGQAVAVGMVPGNADTTVQVEGLKEKLTLINSLVGGVKNSGAVGPNPLARTSITSFITGTRQNFVAGVKQLTSQETLNQLLSLKKAGGTLGALSDQERIMLSNAASKINGWEIKDDKGNGTGFYNAREKDFKAELEKLQKLTRKALIEAAPPGFNLDEEEINQINGMVGNDKTPSSEFNPAKYY
jgi:hypothetical protein